MRHLHTSWKSPPSRVNPPTWREIHGTRECLADGDPLSPDGHFKRAWSGSVRVCDLVRFPGATSHSVEAMTLPRI